MSIKRYDYHHDGEHEEKDGCWVRYDDIAPLIDGLKNPGSVPTYTDRKRDRAESRGFDDGWNAAIDALRQALSESKG